MELNFNGKNIINSINPLHMCDCYKLGHRDQYPEGTELVYSNLTPRSTAHANLGDSYDDKIMFFGLQAFIKTFLIDAWNEGFFNLPKELVVATYRKRVEGILGPDALEYSHIEALHDLGYLPIEIRALPEGTRVPTKVPVLTIHNTVPEFYWVTNYLETLLSAELWKTCTSATIAFEYKKILTKAAIRTGAPVDFVPLQAHDFSFRGMSGVDDARKSGAGHLTSFMGTDTIPAIDYIYDLYAPSEDYQVPIGLSVPATEHAIMSMAGKEDEIETFRRLITKTYPTGIVSIVSDTWDFWKVITEYLPTLKDEIMNRQPNAIGLNKVVIRPDSGDPVDIICGTTSQWFRDTYDELVEWTPEQKGAIECLWETFGGTITDKGYKLLDEHIGLIYGDSITLDRAQEIVDKLEVKGFASTNVVFGVGSYTYQYVTRDTFGFAMKATAGKVNGEYREIFKDPKTDTGSKKSAKGFIRVIRDSDGELILLDQQNPTVTLMDAHGGSSLLVPVFIDGHLNKDVGFDEVRATVDNELEIALGK